MTSTTTAGLPPLSRDEAELNEVDRGGHFAAWEEPELFATEVRAAFRSVR
jgi:pimeloyl-ACP methyl ester carboxylesterase